MTNFEKYKDEIIKAVFFNNECDFMKEHVLGGNCTGVSCHDCREMTREWFDAEYVEPTVDWSKVEVDTLILVKYMNGTWRKRYFAKYENGLVHVFACGATSKTAEDGRLLEYPRNEAKLAEVE